jgi:hypothetical protein
MMYIDDHQLVGSQHRRKAQLIALRPAHRYSYSKTTRVGNVYGRPGRSTSRYVLIGEGLGQVAAPSPTLRPSNSSQTSLIEDALRLKLESLAIGIAVLQGRDNENDLTDLVFFAKHQGLKDRKIDPRIDPKLVQEWNRILRNVVRPTVKAARRKVRSKYLRKLAAYPPLAHGKWKRLSPVEQAHVVTFMAKHFGNAFASRFLEYAAGQRKRDLVQSAWFVDDLRKALGPYPKWLLDRGYKLGGTWATSLAAYDEWFYPSGRWITVIRPLTESKPQTPGTEPPAVLEEHPDVTEIRRYVRSLEEKRAHLVKLVTWLKNHANATEYCRHWNKYWETLNGFIKEVNWARREVLNLMEEVEPHDLPALEMEQHRLEDLGAWEREKVPELHRALFPTVTQSCQPTGSR